MDSDLDKGKFWNVSVTPGPGCTAVKDPAHPCRICWARQLVRLRPQISGGNGFCPTWLPERLSLPQWRQPKVCFWNICGDWCHKRFTDDQRSLALAAMATRPESIFLTCTKRWGILEAFVALFKDLAEPAEPRRIPRNAWFGATGWNEPSAINALQMLARLRTVNPLWFSAEPLLGPIRDRGAVRIPLSSMRWMVTGPETGPGHRVADPEWFKQIIGMCAEDGVPLWVKAFPVGKRVSHKMSEWPVWARVRELPPELDRILRGKP